MSYPVREAAQPDQKSYVVASFGWRLSAFLLDGLVITAVAAGIGVVLGLAGMVITTTTAEGVRSTGVVSNIGWSALVFGLVSAPYCIGGWAMQGATQAQMAMGLRVFRASGPQCLSFGSSVLRWALLFGLVSMLGALGGLNPYLGGLAGWFQLIWLIALIATTARDPRKHGLHDRLAGSVVVRVRGSSAVGLFGFFFRFFGLGGPVGLIRGLAGTRRRVDGQIQHLDQVEGLAPGALKDLPPAAEVVRDQDGLGGGGSDDQTV
jgi:uncharacterized RDD family membrane protein YckC